MEILVQVLSKLDIISLLFILFLSVLGLYGILKKLRNERTKRVECLEIINPKKIRVINRFAYLVPISFWKKHITSDKIIKYMENEREVYIAGVISDEEIEDARLKNKILKFLKKEIKGKNIKLCYRFKKKPDVFLWRNTYHIFREKISFFQKLKKFFKLWLIKYHYYFDIIYLNKDKRKSVLNNDMILTFKVYTHKESIVQMFRYRKVINKVKFSQKEEEKTDVEKDTKLSPVWDSEIKDEKLEDISYRKD